MVGNIIPKSVKCIHSATNPEGPTYTTIMELGPQNQNRDGFLGA